MNKPANPHGVALFLIAVLCSPIVICRAQGPLGPPGAPAPSMKTLEQVEPRTVITNLPYTISAAGSYYLTGNLNGLPTFRGIIVGASDVFLDLNGFVLTGLSNALDGILIQAGRENIVIRNGVIRNWGQSGIGCLGGNVILENLTLCSNSEWGVRAGGAVQARACSFAQNGFGGAWLGAGSTLRDCRISGNAQAGAVVEDGGLVRGCVIQNNAGGGVIVGSGCQVRNNSCLTNAGGGVAAGILATGTGACVMGNLVSGNDIGLRVTGTNNLVADNIVRGNGDNYEFAAGNQVNLLLCEIPERIDFPASIRLAGTLGPATTGIVITANHVLIDLNGHALVGTAGAGGYGINQRSSNCFLRIMNGTVRQWTSINAGLYAPGRFNMISGMNCYSNYDGIKCGDMAIISDCQIATNSSSGIEGADASIVRGCAARENRYDGIAASGVISDNVAERNNSGFQLLAGLLLDCDAKDNRGAGLEPSSDCLVSKCTSIGNGGMGIMGGSSDFIKDCTVVDNVGYGIDVTSLSWVLGNTVYGSSAEYTNWCVYLDVFGIRADENTMYGYGRGLYVGNAYNIIFRNVSRCEVTNYSIVGGNAVGRIESVSHTTYSNNNPWANIDVGL